jgi:two-component sensor histidine kinase
MRNAMSFGRFGPHGLDLAPRRTSQPSPLSEELQSMRFIQTLYSFVKAFIVSIVVFGYLWPIADLKDDPLLWIIPVLTPAWYAAKWYVSRHHPLLIIRSVKFSYSSPICHYALAVVESIAISTIVLYLVILHESSAIAITALLLLPLVRIGAYHGYKFIVFLYALAMIIVVLINIFANHISIRERVLSALLSMICLASPNLLLLYSIWHRKTLERIFKYDQLTYKQSLERLAERVLQEGRADIIVIYPWHHDGPTPTPIIRVLDGIKMNDIEYLYDKSKCNRSLSSSHPLGYLVEQYSKLGRQCIFREHIVGDDLYGTGINDRDYPSFVVRENISSSVGVVIAGDPSNILAVLWANYRQPHHFDEAERDFFDLISRDSAAELARSRHRTELIAQNVMEARKRVIIDVHDRVKSQIATTARDLLQLELQIRSFSCSDTHAGHMSHREQTCKLLEIVERAANHLHDGIAEIEFIEDDHTEGRMLPQVLKTILANEWNDQYRYQTAPALKFVGWDATSRLPEIMDDVRQLYYVIREALQNAAKHSKATRVTVGLACTDDYIIATVTDNGCGFNLDKPPARIRGLKFMADRVKTHLGGDLEIATAPGKGTQMVLTVPCAGAGRLFRWKVDPWLS